MDRNERARIVRTPLRADPPPARRAARGPRWKSGALLRAEAIGGGAQECVLFASGSPSAPVDGGREGPQGRAQDARAFAAMQDASSSNPGRRPRTFRAAEGGAVGVSFLLVTSLWTSKEKSPARRDAGRTRMDAGRLSRRKRAHRKQDTAKAPSPRPIPQAREGERHAQHQTAAASATSPSIRRHTHAPRLALSIAAMRASCRTISA